MTETAQLIWTEKYRPQKFEELQGQDEVVSKVKAFVQAKNMPHLLFAGPAGVGKSTLALIIVKTLYGEEWRRNFLELNASDERGIDVVRTKVKDFARTKAIGNAPFKIIFLDECDALTRDAQQALRRTMENTVHTCRFVLSCVTPDTKILLPEEQEITIGEFFKKYEQGNPIHVQNITSEKDTSKKDTVLAAVQLPASAIGKKVLQLSTMTGRILKLTEDHKILTDHGWKEACHIREGDCVLVYPHLEGTTPENNCTRIVDVNDFVEYLSQIESEHAYARIHQTHTFSAFTTVQKKKVISRINSLKERMRRGTDLTTREFEVYSHIQKKPGIMRKDLQEKVGLTRMGINYLLPSLERKKYVQRHVKKEIHSFNPLLSNPIILRNEMDIKRIVEQEFGITISYTTIRNSDDLAKNRGCTDRVLGELKRKNILDITYNDTTIIGSLARIVGFMLGDGHLVRNNIRLHFAGNKDALREVQKDLDILGFKNYSQIHSAHISNIIQGRQVTGISTCFTLDSRALSLLLQYLGIPKGDKTITPYSVPVFIKKGTKLVKREFLRALFGCDADKPNYKKKNFCVLSLRQNKAQHLQKEEFKYLKEIAELLHTFEITSYVNVQDKGERRRKDGIFVFTFSLILHSNNENMRRYFSRVRYAYEKKKNIISRYASEYLRHKAHIITLLKEKSIIAETLLKEGKSIRAIACQIHTSPDFIANQLKGKDIHLPRKDFPSFDEWMQQYVYNDILIKQTVLSIKEINEDIVMDITCHQDHNFITNGIISHNCNYSSKIIDPIQSRCAVFKFKQVSPEYMKKIIEGIVKREEIIITPETVEAIVHISGGDCRRAENILQSCAVLTKNITPELVLSLASTAHPKEIKQIVETAYNGEYQEARKQLHNIMPKYGMSALDVLKQVQQEIINTNIPDEEKVELIAQSGEAEFHITEGSDEIIQIEAYLAHICVRGIRNKKNN